MTGARLRWLALLATLGAAACKNKAGAATTDPTTSTTAPVDSGKAAPPLALPVVGEPVRKGDLILTVSATGQIRTDATTTLKAETGGTVTAVLVRAGDKVTRGQETGPPRLGAADARPAQRAGAARHGTDELPRRDRTDSIGGIADHGCPEARLCPGASPGSKPPTFALETRQAGARARRRCGHPIDGVMEKVIRRGRRPHQPGHRRRRDRRPHQPPGRGPGARARHAAAARRAAMRQITVAAMPDRIRCTAPSPRSCRWSTAVTRAGRAVDPHQGRRHPAPGDVRRHPARGESPAQPDHRSRQGA